MRTAARADCRAALGAADAAFTVWARTRSRERARMIRRAADRLRDEAASLARTISLETGKPRGESREEVALAADYLDWGAEEAPRISGAIDVHPDGACRFLCVRRPVGPCLVVTPWNFPLAIPARGLAPALAAGCTVVLRASDQAPLSAVGLVRVLEAAGVPAGCVNLVVSSEAGATDGLLSDSRLRKLTFTGSTRVGGHLLGLAASRALRASVELGGNAPFIVLADADLEVAVGSAVEAKCRNGGQACTAANRFYVERPVAQEFSVRLAQRMAALAMGPGLEEGTQLGPVISAAAARRLQALADDAVARGAHVVLPGGLTAGPGHFFAPVVLADVPHDALVMRQEIFGPVAAIASVAGEEEAIRRANDCQVGLAAYVMSSDVGRALRVGEALEVGMVGINRGRVSCASAPFGGVKGSGFGRSGGREGIDEYLDLAYLAISEPTR